MLFPEKKITHAHGIYKDWPNIYPAILINFKKEIVALPAVKNV
jgi:hypothetical protein